MTAPKAIAIAIVGGGIAGAAAAEALSKHDGLTIHLFDQGRRGPGGRASSRSAEATTTTGDDNVGDGNGNDYDDATMRWDHGCQFFRADTPQFRDMVEGWMAGGFVREWKGEFAKFPGGASSDLEFFGLPSAPPFYVGRDGMQSVARGVLDDVEKKLSGSSSKKTSSSSSSSSLRVFAGTRVARMERDDDDDDGEDRPRPRRWKLYGTRGIAAYHDTAEKLVQQQQQSPDGNGSGRGELIGESCGYDAIILTDVSSSFGGWHRASAGVPEEFAARVRERVGARVPLFAATIAFEGSLGVPFDAASFDDEVVWFAARSGSKPGMDNAGQRECWTIVSTPEYAMAKIEETPMQDPISGEFIPQSEEYLTSVPGPDLLNSFRSLLLRRKDVALAGELPDAVHVDAQRWGSALPCHRHLACVSPTRTVISGVPYDYGRFPLAPTREERTKCDGDDGRSFLVDENLMLLQAGDMMSCLTPGFEGAALSGCQAADHLYGLFNSICSSSSS